MISFLSNLVKCVRDLFYMVMGRTWIKMIQENIKEIQANIAAACERAGRDINEVHLISVSKTKPVEMLQEAYNAGSRDFGENKVQELCDKIPLLPSDIRWHMIGHLQTNKIKYLIDKVYRIHSVDSLHLAEAISTEAVKHGVTANILLEVNVAEEESKFGVHTDEVMKLAQAVSKLPNLQVKGLMTIAPFVENEEENRQYFRILRQLAVDISRKSIDNVTMNELSMGMTGDYRVAVEEGATWVRVGTGIFGERNYAI